MKTGIVCEGGGMRGVFTAGVLQALMDGGFVADLLVGVSAGASNGASYASGQRGRGFRTNVNYVGSPRYAGLRSYLATGSYFGMDFIFGEIPEKLDPFDYDAFHASPCGYWAGATDVHTGRPVFFGKPWVRPGLEALRASCAMPLLSPMVRVDGGLYLDGGVAAPIPIGKALAEGCERLVVVLTRPRGFIKKPQRLAAAYKTVYRHYPEMVRAIARRHEVYNEALRQLWQLEKEGVAIVAAPPAPLAVGRLGKKKDELAGAYGIGTVVGGAVLKKL